MFSSSETAVLARTPNCTHTDPRRPLLLIDRNALFTEQDLEDVQRWQRGSNENINDLLCQYLPKGCNLANFSDAEIQRIEDKINRKRQPTPPCAVNR